MMMSGSRQWVLCARFRAATFRGPCQLTRLLGVCGRRPHTLLTTGQAMACSTWGGAPGNPGGRWGGGVATPALNGSGRRRYGASVGEDGRAAVDSDVEQLMDTPRDGRSCTAFPWFNIVSRPASRHPVRFRRLTYALCAVQPRSCAVFVPSARGIVGLAWLRAHVHIGVSPLAAVAPFER